MFDLGILNGQIYLGDGWYRGNLYIKEGKVNTLSEEILPCNTTYDAKGHWVLPGFIDPHVHFSLNVGSYTSKDDFYSGSIEAAKGGFTTFLDFLDPIKTSDSLKDAFTVRQNLAKDSVIDYGFHTTLADPTDSPLNIVKTSQRLGIPTIKLFTTYSSSERRTYDAYIDKLLSLSLEHKVRILAHVENEALLEEGVLVSDHGHARPPLSEISEVIKLAEMTHYRKGLLYVVHTNCGTTLERVKALYPDLLHHGLILESCPHYFSFSSDIYQTKEGHLYTMTPPLRPKDEVTKLIENFDAIDVIGTDHCPFKAEEKDQLTTDKIPMGITGLAYSFSTMFQLFGASVIDKFTCQPAKIHGLYPKKGTLMPKADGDVVIFDPNSSWQPSEGIYKGIPMKGQVISSLCRGEFVIKDGEFVGQPAYGRYIERELKFIESNYK